MTDCMRMQAEIWAGPGDQAGPSERIKTYEYNCMIPIFFAIRVDARFAAILDCTELIETG
jgi:hypothetical protein